MDEEGGVLSWDRESLNGEVKINSDQGLKLTFPHCRIISVQHSWSPEFFYDRAPYRVGPKQILRLEFEVIDASCQVQKMKVWDIIKLLWRRPMKGSPFDLTYKEEKHE